MRFFIASLAVLVTLLGGVSAHFSLQYPIPRGVFDAKNEVTFCGASISFSIVHINIGRLIKG